MNPAKKDEISQWFDLGVKKKKARMVIVCDTYDHNDYFVFLDDDVFWDEYPKYCKNMQKIMEVYDLRLSKESQLSEIRAWHFPPQPKG
jgi:hypothetical protein